MATRRSRRGWLVLAAFAGALVVTYWPALHGDFLWDDVAHLPEPPLRTWSGLRRILFEPGASQQYYPVLFGTFWAEYRLWGETTLGYHLVNVAMHGLGATLRWAVLRGLAIPGALLAAAVFALHPVHVESVAWVCELKNTLSGVFYLTALLVYLVFDDTRHLGAWAASFALFVAAMLSKSVTGSLPAAILVLFWWKRGRLSWRADVLPLLPFFAAAAGVGWFTARYEAEVVGAQGAAFDLSFAARCLIAGRALWFYVGKILWPARVVVVAGLTWRQAHGYQSLEPRWTHTVEHNPGSFLAQIGLGVVYEDQGRHAEAIVAEERAVAIDPMSPEAHLNLARSYDHLGDYPKAAALYERGLALGAAYAPLVLPRLARLYVRPRALAP